MTNNETVTRRAWLRAGLGALAGVGGTALVPRRAGARSVAQLPGRGSAQDSLVGTLASPWAAGQDRARVVPGDNDPFIIDIENRLKCTCGCAHSIYACRTTDFTCGYWQDLHAGIIAMAGSGYSAEEIIDVYVDEHGTQYLMAPPPRGFNLAGYFVPGVLISIIAASMFWVLKRRSALAPDGPVPEAAWSDFSDAERERLEEELRHLDT